MISVASSSVISVSSTILDVSTDIDDELSFKLSLELSLKSDLLLDLLVDVERKSDPLLDVELDFRLINNSNTLETNKPNRKNIRTSL